jgi:hypothetical protein
LSKLTVEATGETFIVRRVAIDAWIMAGKMPETLAREVLSAWHQMGAGDAVENMSVDQLMSGFQVVRDLVVAACVSPKLVTGDGADPEKDEIHFAELEAKSAPLELIDERRRCHAHRSHQWKPDARGRHELSEGGERAHLFLLAKR